MSQLIISLAAGQASDLHQVLAGLNPAAATLQQMLAQLNLAYATGVVVKRINEEAAGDPASLAEWLAAVSGQVSAETALPLPEAERLVFLALCRLVGMDEPLLFGGDGLYSVSVALVMMARRRIGSHRQLADLDGFFVGEVAGEERCLHLTFEDEETCVIDIFDRQAAADDSEKGKLVAAPIVINLKTGAVRLEQETEQPHR